MNTGISTWRDWPALADLGSARRWRFQCSHGVWGPPPDGAGPPRWLAASADFDAAARTRTAVLDLGSEDDPAPLLWWRGEAAVFQAGHAYPRPGGAPGRPPRLERLVIEWVGSAALPAALAALALLPRVAEPDQPRWQEPTPGPGTDPARLPPLGVHASEFAFAELIATGCTELATQVQPEALATSYAELLTGRPWVLLPATANPLSAAALAVLLLPLERAQADRLAMVSRLPSTRFAVPRPGADGTGTATTWHLLGSGGCPPGTFPAPVEPPTAAQRERGAALAQALLANDPAALRRPGPVPAGQPPAPAPGPDADGTRVLRIWGPASSGKTAYLGQIFTTLRRDPSGWTVRLPPNADEEWFKRMLESRKENRFPPPTSASKQLIYRLIHEPTGRSAQVAIEDRPGEEYQVFDAATAQRLATADGLMLLIDPLREPGLQNDEVRRALLAMQQRRGDPDRDPRPLAVCVSKCDEYIRTVADYRCARDTPEVFLRDLVGPALHQALNYYFSRVRLFALSAVGLRIVHGAIQPTVFYDETLEPRIGSLGEPMNLREPLLWVIEQIGQLGP